MSLTDNQKRLMAAIRAAAALNGQPPRLTTEQLGRVRDRSRNQLSPDAARKAMARLEDRGLVTGDGAGREREWWLTAAGAAAIDEAMPPRSESESEAGREYTVLEETTLSELLRRRTGEGLTDDDPTIYVVVGTVEARNTEHAFRQVAKDVYAERAADNDDDVLTVRSVAVDGKRWKVTPVNVKADPRVTIG